MSHRTYCVRFSGVEMFVSVREFLMSMCNEKFSR